MKNKKKKKLYIVSTPIGNLEDITYRAIRILKKTDIILAENIKHTKKLTNNFNIRTKILKFNDNYNQKKIKSLIEIIKSGKNMALVSNAGTPAINDPGYKIINECHLSNIRVVPIPGPCAAITAISSSGIQSNKFCYEGFLPKKKKLKEDLLNILKKEKRTIIIYESPYRIIQSLQMIVDIFGKTRKILFAREMTKIWEKIYKTNTMNLLYLIKNKKIKYKGEIVIIIEGFKKKKNVFSEKIINTFEILKKNLSTKKAIKLTTKIYKIKKNKLYNFIIQKISLNKNL